MLPSWGRALPGSREGAWQRRRHHAPRPGWGPNPSLWWFGGGAGVAAVERVDAGPKPPSTPGALAQGVTTAQAGSCPAPCTRAIQPWPRSGLSGSRPRPCNQGRQPPAFLRHIVAVPCVGVARPGLHVHFGGGQVPGYLALGRVHVKHRPLQTSWPRRASERPRPRVGA